MNMKNKKRYANYHPEFYITLVYIYATCASVAANMFYFVDKFVIPMYPCLV